MQAERSGNSESFRRSHGVSARAFLLRLLLGLLFCHSAFATAIFRGTFEDEATTPLALAQVELRASDESVKATAVTDTWGNFPPFSAAQMVAGDSIVAFGGTWGADEFSGEFRLPVDSPGVSQSLNPVTTLVHAVAQSSMVTNAPPGRLINAVNLLTARGLIDADWRLGSPQRVDGNLRAHVQARGGMQSWAAELIVDLADGDLDRSWMVSFPHVHGGVADIPLDEVEVEWLRGDQVEVQLAVDSTIPAPAVGWSFSKELGPSWVSISAGGLLSVSVPADAPNGSGPLRIRVLNPESGRFRDVEIDYAVRIGAVVAQATYGALGGTLWLPDNSMGIEVPDGAFSTSTQVEWLRIDDPDGGVRHRLRTEPRNRPFLLPTRLLRSNPRQSEFGPPNCQGVAGWGTGWFAKSCGEATFASVAFHSPGAPSAVTLVTSNRLPFATSYNLPAGFRLDFDEGDLAWVLGARCNTDCLGKTPVLFIHGYTALGGIGGGASTWGDLRELVPELGGSSTWVAYEFRYRSNASFQELADDLREAVEQVFNETGQPVHIVAHSFGGLLARTYLQGLIPGTPIIGAPVASCSQSRHPLVASLTTLGTPHAGIAADAGSFHGTTLPIGRQGGGQGIGVCRQSSCWQAGEANPFARAPTLTGIFGVESQPGFIPARLADFSTYPLPVPSMSLIGLETSGDGFAGGDYLISYQGQRFSPLQSCPSGSCSDSAVVAPASIAMGHCTFERVLGTVIANAAPLPVISQQRSQTMRQTYGHADFVALQPNASEVDVRRAVHLDDNQLDRSRHDATHRLRDWLRSRNPDPAARLLKVSVSGAGAVEIDMGGTVESCSNACVYTNAPAQVRIRAVPAGGSFLIMAPRPCTNALAWCDWRVGPYESIGAAFNASGQPTLELRVSGAGRVLANPGALVCTGTCRYSFDPLTVVTLTAESTGGNFTAWGSACAGATANCTIIMPASTGLPRIVSATFSTPPAPQLRPLNDTGMNWCANDTANYLSCPQAGFPDQDGDHGRDALARAGQLPKIGGGEAGFDYTKISNSGQPLGAGAALGTGAGDWGCTRDNVTGLIWEVKLNNAASLRHMAHTYTWYDTNAASNGGNAGTIGTAATCNSTLTQCNTSAFVAAVNAQGLCGANDWRMPTPEELQGIVHYGTYSPTIDPGYFPNTSASGYSAYFWTGTNVAADASFAWFVSFFNGYVLSYSKSYYYGVRLVRGGQ